MASKDLRAFLRVQHGSVGENHTTNDDIPPDRLRLTVPDAARVLGISPEAVRNRLSRGTLESIKDQGTVYVLMYRDMVRHTADIPIDRPGESGVLISEMRGRIEDLRTQLESERQAHAETRRLLAAALERIPPQLEAPAESPSAAPGDTEAADEQQGRGQPRSDAPGVQVGAQRPWWRRVFGG
jgi:hypothetical protein